MSTFTARLFLGLNATFSTVTGAALVLYPNALANWVWATVTGWEPILFRLLGIGLLLFAVYLVLLVSDRYVNRRAVLSIVVADAGWVLSSLCLMVFAGDWLTDAGTVVVGLVALAVTIFATGQFVGASRIQPLLSKVEYQHYQGILTATVRREVSAAEDVIWHVMTDHPGYADVASNITNVEVVSGDGLGMQRRCVGSGGESWLETCDWFVPGQSFGFTVDTDATDYPYPFSKVRGRWSLQPGSAGAGFSIEIDVEPRGGWLVKKLFPLLAPRQFTPILVDLADAWAGRMEAMARP